MVLELRPMFNCLKSVFTRNRRNELAAAPIFETVLAPDAPFYAVGDIHGCHELMEKLVAQIRAEDKDASIVFVGDYVDRGVRSAQVLETLFHMQQATPDLVICLMGNHERMLLEFIDDPLGRGARWLVNGGIETLASYGISGVKQRPDEDDALNVADQLEAAMPNGLQEWLRALPLQWSSGNVHVVHAAMDPNTPPDAQKERHLLWGHREFLREPREDGACVVFGHVIVPNPDVRDGRIAIDTGAYKTGKLTAVRVDAEGWSFLQA